MITRRQVGATLWTSCLLACRRRSYGHDSALLTRLAEASERQGLGIGLLGADAVYVKYFDDLHSRRDVPIHPTAMKGNPALLTDWGHALAVREDEWVQISDLAGHSSARAKLGIEPEGCVFDEAGKRVLIWGRGQASANYEVHVIDLSTQTASKSLSIPTTGRSDGQTLDASFGHNNTIELSVGFDDYSVSASAKRLREGWALARLTGSPDGNRWVGRNRKGTLEVRELDSGRAIDTGIKPVGRASWDPSSRYVFAVTRTDAPLWSAQSEFIVFDIDTGETATLPSIIPDTFEHPYQWVLLPRGTERRADNELR